MRVGRKLVVLLVVVAVVVVVMCLPIIPVVKTETYPVSRTVMRSRTLFEGRNLYIPLLGYRYSGPYYLRAGETITVTWEADSPVNVYIMNEVDWGKRFLGAPTSFRAFSWGTSGSVSYTLRYDEPIYVQVMSPTWSAAKLYFWREEVSWRETVTTYESRTVYEYKSILAIIYEALTEGSMRIKPVKP